MTLVTVVHFGIGKFSVYHASLPQSWHHSLSHQYTEFGKEYSLSKISVKWTETLFHFSGHPERSKGLYTGAIVTLKNGHTHLGTNTGLGRR